MGKDSRFLDNLSSPQIDENFKRSGVLIDALLALINNLTGEIAFPIYFNSNGGSAVNPQYAVVGQKVTKPSDPTKSGYTFDAWYSDAELTTAYDFADEVTSEELGFTLYAKWLELFDLSVTATHATVVVTDANDEVITAGSNKVVVGEVLTITATAEAGYNLTTFTVNTVAETSPKTFVVTKANVVIVATGTQ